VDNLKDFFLHKITLRVCYIVGAYAASNLINFLASQKYQAISEASGVELTIHDPEKMKTWLIGLLLIGGEFVYRFLHTKLILPIVKKEEVK
jgi:hypothetical protein